jgi:hypothetical protein
MLRRPFFGRALSALHRVRKEKLCASLRPPLFKIKNKNAKVLRILPTQTTEEKRRSRKACAQNKRKNLPKKNEKFACPENSSDELRKRVRLSRKMRTAYRGKLFARKQPHSVLDPSR